MPGIRRDVATLGNGWNDTLLNYALAVRELDSRDIGKRNSWKFLAAMHGIVPNGWVVNGFLGSIAEIPAELLDNRTYGNQCRHGSWYFLSWHRGYLAAFEAIVADMVRQINGDDWSLPYWNYLDDTNPDALNIPWAFLQDTLPDGSPNPLKSYPRGQDQQGQEVTALEPLPGDEFSLVSMTDEHDFVVGTDGVIGFGGGSTQGNFDPGGRMTGDLENNPHNTVHGMIGGCMGNPYYAALDPIFWLHHCNIDRLWQAWMETPGNKMVRDQDWLEGPVDRAFIMPQIDGADPGIIFESRDTLKNGKFFPTYDNLTAGTGVTPGGAAVAGVGMGPSEQQTVDTIGANEMTVTVGSAAAETRVSLDEVASAGAVTKMGAITPGEEVVRLYLALEGITGTAPSPQLSVYVNVPEGDNPDDHPELRAGAPRLFGLNVASDPDGQHGGNGMAIKMDITDLAARLKAKGDFDLDHLRVTLVPGVGISADEPVSVDRVVVLKRSGIVTPAP